MVTLIITLVTKSHDPSSRFLSSPLVIRVPLFPLCGFKRREPKTKKGKRVLLKNRDAGKNKTWQLDSADEYRLHMKLTPLQHTKNNEDINKVSQTYSRSLKVGNPIASIIKSIV